MIAKHTIDDSYCRSYYATTYTRQVDGIILSETTYRPSVVIPSHVHDDHAYFSLVLRGGYAERSGKTHLDLLPATVVFHPVGSEHSDEFRGAESRLFDARLKADWLDQIREHAAVLNGPLVLSSGPLVRRQRSSGDRR
jgi:hypothetical protein